MKEGSAIFPTADPKFKYTKEDLEKAFKDGRLYEAGELELDTTGKETTFECWVEQVFKK